MHEQGNADKMAGRLKYAMDQHGISAAELARRAGCHKSSISMYLQGEHAASMRTAEKLATILHVNSAWLMGYDVPMTEDDAESPTSPMDLIRRRFLTVGNTMVNIDHIVTITQGENQNMIIMLDTGNTVEGVIS